MRAEQYEVVQNDGCTEIRLPPKNARRTAWLGAFGFGATAGATAAVVGSLVWTAAGLTHPPGWAAALIAGVFVLVGSTAAVHRFLDQKANRSLRFDPVGRVTFGMRTLVEEGTTVGVSVHELEDSEYRPTYAVLVVVRGQKGQWLPIPAQAGFAFWLETAGAGFASRADAERCAAVAAAGLGVTVLRLPAAPGAGDD